MDKGLFALPMFPVGTGLGNRLFHWCDARIFCFDHNATFVSPLWIRFSPRRFLRDLSKGNLRSSSLLEYPNSFRCLPGDLHFYCGILRAAHCRRISNSDLKALDGSRDSPPRFIFFNSSDYRFDNYQKYRGELARMLLDSMLSRCIPGSSRWSQPFIGIHIRLGDGFRPPEPGLDGFVRTGWLQQTPLNWFIHTLRFIREVAKVDIPAYVFSDGTRAELTPILSLKNVKLFPVHDPVTELVMLSRSLIILGSGSSSFSAFAAFLGSAHAITAPGHPLSARGLESSDGQTIGVFNPLDDCSRAWFAKSLTCNMQI